MTANLKYLFVGMLILLSNDIIFGQNIDSLKLVLKNAQHDSTKVKILSELSEVCEVEDILKYAEPCVELAQKNASGSTDQRTKLFFLKYLSAALTNIGYLAHEQGNISKALEYFHRSLKIREEYGDKLEIANAIANIAVIYKNQGDIHKALEYHLKSLRLLEEIGDKNAIAMSLNNIGVVFDHLGDIPKALDYFNRSLEMNEEIGDKVGIAHSLNNIGIIFDGRGDFAKAFDYFQKSLKIREQVGDKREISYSLNNLAKLMLKKDQTREALIYAKRSMKIAEDFGFPEDIKNSASTMKFVFQKQNAYKEAFEMLELEIKMRDSINNQETQKAAVKKQMQYDYDKKELQLKAEQDKKDLLSKEELKQKEKERNYFMAGFALVMVLAIFIFRGYRQKQKANTIITQQKHLVEVKQKEIIDSIHYAKKIQTALMTNENYIDKNLERLNKN